MSSGRSPPMSHLSSRAGAPEGQKDAENGHLPPFALETFRRRGYKIAWDERGEAVMGSANHLKPSNDLGLPGRSLVANHAYERPEREACANGRCWSSTTSRRQPNDSPARPSETAVVELDAATSASSCHRAQVERLPPSSMISLQTLVRMTHRADHRADANVRLTATSSSMTDRPVRAGLTLGPLVAWFATSEPSW